MESTKTYQDNMREGLREAFHALYFLLATNLHENTRNGNILLSHQMLICSSSDMSLVVTCLLDDPGCRAHKAECRVI